MNNYDITALFAAGKTAPVANGRGTMRIKDGTLWSYDDAIAMWWCQG